jgi:hypothetical protein
MPTIEKNRMEYLYFVYKIKINIKLIYKAYNIMCKNIDSVRSQYIHGLQAFQRKLKLIIFCCLCLILPPRCCLTHFENSNIFEKDVEKWGGGRGISSYC